MIDTQILNRLDGTGIRREADSAVPMNGKVIPLPYMVVRQEVTVEGSDNGAVRFAVISWTVALFTANRDETRERLILRALAGVGPVRIERFPDGTPYQTNFEFTTRQIMR